MADIRRLPSPRADAWEWQLRGACRNTDSELFFHPENERGPARFGRERAAKAVCRRCPVLARCRDHALSVREPYGVWGGMTESERERCLARESHQPHLV
ncbi:MAG: WhiB family transcriptional regulator [Actinomycetota bacterium]|nr:WhiB family transcriptional regulator [Actinomycetota bacterium]